ncbi:MAG TPA: hypothetical protein VFK85_02520 [Anaeromyxobacteraceae bacterium]|nr:hypothetical protein [Anaeromyxobacteraceae bacterium]
MASSGTPYWALVSVLFSSFPLSPTLGMVLYDAAIGLWRRGEAMTPIAGELFQGRVTNLDKHMLLGTIGGPAFEADVDTERGKGKVRFVVTSEGLERAGLQERAARPRRELLN